MCEYNLHFNCLHMYICGHVDCDVSSICYKGGEIFKRKSYWGCRSWSVSEDEIQLYINEIQQED